MAARPFQPWLNIYDRRDLLAFIAEPVWPEEPAIRDHRVDLGLGFPEVHGPAYFSQAGVHRRDPRPSGRDRDDGQL